MGMRITTNVLSLNAQRAMSTSQREMSKSMAQLSTGSRITKAADDASGLAISENLKSQIRSMGQASRNASDGISMVQVAEGGLGEVSNILTRMRELGIQSATDTMGDKERSYLNVEVQQLKSEIQRIAQTTSFGSKKLLDGTGGLFEFQVGINNDSSTDRIAFDTAELNSTAGNLEIDSFDFSSKEGAQESLAKIDDAQSKVSSYRATLGAIQNRFVSTVENLSSQHENLSAANSRIRDTDIAQATSESTRNNILLQASTSMLSQANQVPSLALKMLG
jgi:flagellin